MDTTPEDVERLRAAVESVHAPAALRARVATQLADAQRRRERRRRRSLTGAVATAVAATAAALLVALPGQAGPSVAEVAGLAAAPAPAPAPAVDRADPYRLTAQVAGVAFPSWRGLGSWTPSGQRSATIDGRRAVTVSYRRRDGARVGYTIVSGEALAWPQGARSVRRAGTEYRLLTVGAHRVVTWRRNGHQCVIAAPRSLTDGQLVALAAWNARGDERGA